MRLINQLMPHWGISVGGGTMEIKRVSKHPCGFSYRLPRFCKDKKCISCPLNKEIAVIAKRTK